MILQRVHAMNGSTLFRLFLVSALLVIWCILIMPMNVFAVSTDTEHISIELTAEEQAFCDRTDEITIGCQIDNCPILFKNEETGQIDGITIDILDMISKETGLAFRYQALPAGGITYETLQSLGVDMVAGVEYNTVNKDSAGIAMTDPYIHTEKVFVCKKGTVFQPDSQMVVAVASGSQTIERVIREQYPEIQVMFYDSAEDALHALLNGKADAVLQNQYMTERLLCKPVYENLQVVAAASIGDSQCLACIVPINEEHKNNISDDTALLLSVINKGIACLDEDEVSFAIIKGTADNAYQFTMWDTLYRYRVVIAMLLISVLVIVILSHKNYTLRQKHQDQLATQQRARELAAINERMREQQLLLIDSLKQAEEGNRTKTTFLFNISHDVRTPMNAILGFAEIARSNIDDTDKLMDCIEKIQTSGKSLLHLIDNVLDMSKIKNGNVTLTADGCDLEECIETARDVLLPEIDKKNLTFRTDMSAVENKWVYCDKTRINHILLDLLNNAVKFNKQGGSILVTVSQKNCNIKEYADYEIHIKDTGIGMTKEFLSHIFEPFERERTSTMSGTQGVGLGMSITKNLVDLMGGTIQVFSEVDEGTEFVLKFTFKLHEHERMQTEQAQPELPSAGTAYAYDFSGKRLLLVEDNELNMEIASELLCSAGFEVETAQNGQIAVEMVQNSSVGYYDVILMDIQMPVMDGYQASRKIRSLERKDLAEIPIIALTANVLDEDKKKALSNGMNAHIAKPLDIKVMFEVLGNILQS